MAKNIDEKKILNVEDAAKELIIHNGYGGASISAIAKKAGVAVGYLYRFHNSKQEFVEKMLISIFEVILSNIKDSYAKEKSIRKFISYLIDSIVEIAEKRPLDIQLLYVLMHSYNFKISKEQMDRISILAIDLVDTGVKSGELKQDVNHEEFYNILVTYPIVFINQRFKGSLNKVGWTKNDINRLKQFCMNTLTN